MTDRPNAKQIQEHEERKRTARWDAFYADAAPQHAKTTASKVSLYQMREEDILRQIGSDFPNHEIAEAAQEWLKDCPPDTTRNLDGQSFRVVLEGYSSDFKRWAIRHKPELRNLPDPKSLELQRNRSY